MSRRRQPEEDSSLDLLLDTVCNAFGGIIFIVLMVSLLPSRFTASAVPGSKPLDPAKASELQQLEVSLVAAREVLKLHQHSPTTASAAQREIERIRGELVDRRDTLRRELDAAAKDEAAARTSLADAQEQLRRLEALRQRIQQSISTAKEAHSRDEQRVTRLPRARTVQGKANVFVVITNGRVVLPCMPGSFGRRLRENDTDFDVTIMDRGARKYVPKNGVGVAGADWLKFPDGYEAFRRSFPPDQWVVNFVVYPESVPEFQVLRSALVSGSYDYTWAPVTEKSPLILVPTNEPPHAQ